MWSSLTSLLISYCVRGVRCHRHALFGAGIDSPGDVTDGVFVVGSNIEDHYVGGPPRAFRKASVDILGVVCILLSEDGVMNSSGSLHTNAPSRTDDELGPRRVANS